MYVVEHGTAEGVDDEPLEERGCGCPVGFENVDPSVGFECEYERDGDCGAEDEARGSAVCCGELVAVVLIARVHGTGDAYHDHGDGPGGYLCKAVCGVVYPAQAQGEEQADDEFVVVMYKNFGYAADPEPDAVADHAPRSLGVEGVYLVQGRGMAEPDDGAIDEDIGDAVWEKSEDECPFAVSEVGEGEADEGCEDDSRGMCKGYASKFEVALKLSFSGEGGCSEEVECAQYA